MSKVYKINMAQLTFATLFEIICMCMRDDDEKTFNSFEKIMLKTENLKMGMLILYVLTALLLNWKRMFKKTKVMWALLVLNTVAITFFIGYFSLKV